MSRNGTGGYSLPANSWNPAVDGTIATSADWNSTAADIAAAIQQSVSSDGQTPMTGALNMSGNKITNLANASVAGDAVSLGRLDETDASNLIGYLPSGTGAVATTVQTKLRERQSLNDFGAVGDGVTDDSSAITLAAAWLNAAPYRTLNGVSGCLYKSLVTLQISQDNACFDGDGCAFINAITDKTPLFKLSSLSMQSTVLRNFTVNGSGTPGHVIAIFGAVAGSPSFVAVENVTISGNTGTGLTSTGANTPSHFIWMEGGMSLRVSGCKSYVTSGGIHLLNVQKVSMETTTIDGCTADRTLYVEGCRSVDISDNCVFNGGVGDMCYLTLNSSVSIKGSRFKGGAARQLFVDGVNNSLSIENNNFEVWALASSSVVVSTGTSGAVVSRNNFSLINSGGGTAFTQAVIDVASTGAVVSYSGEISNNVIVLNNGLTLAAAIRLFASTNSIRGWKVENNRVGNDATTSVITDAILLSGTQMDTRVINNTVGMSGTGCSVTNGVNIAAGVSGAVVMGTQQFGTVTNPIVDAGSKTIRESGGVWESQTFTPVVFGGTTAGTATYTTQTGKITKIGNLVFYNIALSWTGHTGTGDLRISGFPFTSSSTSNQVANCLASNLTFSGQLVAYPTVSGNFFRVGNYAGGGAFAFVQMDAAAELYITGVCEIA